MKRDFMVIHSGVLSFAYLLHMLAHSLDRLGEWEKCKQLYCKHSLPILLIRFPPEMNEMKLCHVSVNYFRIQVWMLSIRFRLIFFSLL